MRAEVTVLSRLITIRAETEYVSSVDYTGPDELYWGCRVLVADWLDLGAGLPVPEVGFYRRYGAVSLDYVEVKQCSQKGTWLPALKFENAMGVGELGRSNITNSVLHSGDGVGVIFENSRNVKFHGNALVSFVEHGVWVKSSSQELTITDNWVHHVIPPDDYFGAVTPFDNPVDNDWPLHKPKMFEYVGWTGAFTLSDSSVKKLLVTGNVASGAWHHGFHYKPLECDDSTSTGNLETWFENNVAHSISGYGAIAANVGFGPQKCAEVKNFAAYKVTMASVSLGGLTGTNQATNIVSIDVGLGIGVHGGGCGDVVVKDSHVYGEFAANEDCHDAEPGSCAYCIDRFGMIFSSVYEGEHRDKETINWEWLPLGNYSDCFAGTVKYQDVNFYDFQTDTTACGSK